MIVVDRFEMIDVDQDATKMAPVALPLRPLSGELFIEKPAIPAARERILGGEILQIDVLLLNLHPRLSQLVQELPQICVFLLNGRQVVEGSERAAQGSVVAENGHR